MSNIEWTEKTWNPVVGCTVVSPGCTNCYAMKMAARLERMNPGLEQYRGTTKPSKAGSVWTGKIGIAPDHVLTAPLRRKKPTTYFVNSMSDLFHESIPDGVIDKVFAVMALAPQHTFQVLTKRSSRMRKYMDSHRLFHISASMKVDGEYIVLPSWPLSNVWLGVSAEDQTRANERIPDLLATPAAVRFVSAEPLLGPVNLIDIDYVAFLDTLRREPRPDPDSLNWPRMRYDALRGTLLGPDDIDLPKLDWIIVGGESGTGSRPMHPDWARAVRDQCKAAGTPFFMKQMSCPVKSKMPAIPDDLLTRQYPEVVR